MDVPVPGGSRNGFTMILMVFGSQPLSITVKRLLKADFDKPPPFGC